MPNNAPKTSHPMRGHLAEMWDSLRGDKTKKMGAAAEGFYGFLKGLAAEPCETMPGESESAPCMSCEARAIIKAEAE